MLAINIVQTNYVFHQSPIPFYNQMEEKYHGYEYKLLV